MDTMSKKEGLNRGVNFYELKTQLADLGFVSPELVDRLREATLSNNWQFSIQHREPLARVTLDSWFNLYRPEPEGPVVLHHYDSALYQHGTMNISYRAFEPDVTKDLACQVLSKQIVQALQEEETNPWTLDQVQSRAYLTENNPEKINFFYQLNANIMDTKNVEFLKNSLFNLGFGEKLNTELEKQINAKTPEFTLNTQHEFNQQKVDYTLHFKGGDNLEMYFFNKYDTSINKSDDKELKHTIYINKGNGVTAKEAYNLMEGRAVHKQLFNKDGEKYQAWVKLDKDDVTEGGNQRLKQFSFDAEKFLEGKGIKEMSDPKTQEELVRSLKKGNRQQITVEKDGKEQKFFISASPQYKTVDLYDHQLKRIKREELFPPAQKADNVQKETEAKKETKKQTADQPAKKQSNKRKVTV